ncbi:MAG: YciC family protein [Pseudomonadota bacterium]
MSDILLDVFFFYRKNFRALLAYIIPVSVLITSLSLIIANSFVTTDELEKIKILVGINFLFNPLYLAGLIFLLSALSNNKTVSLSQCLGLGIYKWFVLFIVSVLYGLLTGFGLFLFVLPGIWIFLRLILAPFLVVLNESSPMDAIIDSFRLTESEFWSIAGTTTLIFSLIILLQQSIITFLPDNSIITIVVSVIGDILWSILTILWFRYYDLLKYGN